jgi:hypothetical protein
VELAEYNEKLAEYREYMDLLYQEQGQRLLAVDARRDVWGAILLEVLEGDKAAHAAGRSPDLRPARIVEEILRRDAEALRAAGYNASIGGEVVRVGLFPVAGRRNVCVYRSARLIIDAPYLDETTGHLRGIFSRAEGAFFEQFIHGRHP